MNPYYGYHLFGYRLSLWQGKKNWEFQGVGIIFDLGSRVANKYVGDHKTAPSLKPMGLLSKN
jgi:hypothetical protein